MLHWVFDPVPSDMCIKSYLVFLPSPSKVIKTCSARATIKSAVVLCCELSVASMVLYPLCQERRMDYRTSFQHLVTWIIPQLRRCPKGHFIKGKCEAISTAWLLSVRPLSPATFRRPSPRLKRLWCRWGPTVRRLDATWMSKGCLRQSRGAKLTLNPGPKHADGEAAQWGHVSVAY